MKKWQVWIKRDNGQIVQVGNYSVEKWAVTCRMAFVASGNQAWIIEA